MMNFWDYSVWGSVNMMAVLLLSLLVANMLKRMFRILRVTLIPTSVLAGLLLLLMMAVYRSVTGVAFFDAEFFAKAGSNALEVLTYHALALGFIASTFKETRHPFNKQRRIEIFNTGLTTVASYLMQGIAGLLIAIPFAKTVEGLIPAAGLLFPFGYGQGSGQALNYGSIYETEYGLVGGRSLGLTIAALGFLSASIGGVVFLNILKKKGEFKWQEESVERVMSEEIQSDNEIPMSGGLDKLTVQLAFVSGAYYLAYLIMRLIESFVPALRAVVYGFNFLMGVLAATLIKAVVDAMRKAGWVKRQYRNSFLMDRISNLCFDIMVVAGIAAIRLEVLKGYWGVIIVLGSVGLLITYAYNRFVANVLFPEYRAQQFLVMYGMLTGTASTGIMLLREADPEFKTPAADNLVYQNFPAMVFGFPIMFLAILAPTQPVLTLWILIGLFVLINLLLFRSQIIGRIKSKRK